MNVVMLSRSVFPFHIYGGMEKYVYFLSKHLIQEGIDVEIVSSIPQKNSPRKKMYNGIKYTFLPPTADIRSILYLPRVYLFYKIAADFLGNKNFDILHSYGASSLFYLSSKKRAITVAQSFANEPFKIGGVKKVINYITMYPVAKHVMNSVDAIASEGSKQTNEIIDLYGVDKRKVFALPNGVELSFIRKCISKNKITRRDIGLKESDLVLLIVGRLAGYKGVNYAIDALSSLKKVIGNVKLIIIGAGPEEERIKLLIKKHGLENDVLHFKNIKEELLYSYYSLADICLSLSFL